MSDDGDTLAEGGGSEVYKGWLRGIEGGCVGRQTVISSSLPLLKGVYGLFVYDGDDVDGVKGRRGSPQHPSPNDFSPSQKWGPRIPYSYPGSWILR